MNQIQEPEVQCQIIGGVFSCRDRAQNAAQTLRSIGVKNEDIQVVGRLNKMVVPGLFADTLVNRGFTDSKARFFETALRGGKIFIAVHNIHEPGPIAEIFAKNLAEHSAAESTNCNPGLTDDPLYWVNFRV